LDQIIRRTDSCFEFGSGRSSLWLASRCARLISIEHDEIYFEIIAEQLKHIDNAEILFRPLSDCNPPDSSYIGDFKSLDSGGIDLVLNDGKLRDQVALLAVKKLAPGGVLVIDNAERYLANGFDVPESLGSDVGNMSKIWREFSGLVEYWRRIWLSNGVTTTLILFKP